MYLTQREERALAGEYGKALEISYRVMVATGRLANARKLIPIKWAHVSGVSYLTIGEYGLDFLQMMSRSRETKFKIFTTINPCGMDVENWGSLDIPVEYAEKQLKIISSYQKFGTANSFTCVPFQSYPVPRRGAHVAWAESSAAIYANSFLGLRTNRESAVSALASAITGKTPSSGLHLNRNRKPVKEVKVALKRTLRGSVDFGILGYFAGQRVNGVIGFAGVRSIRDISEAKALCAAIGTLGSSGMLVLGHTPGLESVVFGEKEYEETLADLSDSETGEAVVFGCPQMTIEELYDLSVAVQGKHFKKKCVVFCSSKVFSMAKTRGYADVIERSGATIVRDACADFTPLISSLKVGSVVTDSTKGAHYMKRVHGVKIALKNTKEILATCTA
ncbi:MAG: aconitase X [Nitrososphaerales archaeon]